MDYGSVVQSPILSPIFSFSSHHIYAIMFYLLLKVGEYMKRDCSTCFHARNDDCSQFTCIGYKPVGSVDIDVIQTAAKAHDIRNHGQNKHGSRRFAEAEEHFTSANKPERDIRQGRTLWYKHKRTGDICSGIVETVRINSFDFRFNNRIVQLPYSAINNRLFYTKEEAKRYGQTEAK